MKYLIFIFLLVFFSSIVAAEGFSPSNLVYVLQPNEELCQMISLESDSEAITVSDNWAENENVEWNINLFNTSAEEHSLAITYPLDLSIDEREVEVCVSGSHIGEYHGVIIFRQAQEGTSIIQLAVWLKVIIEERQTEQQIPSANNGNSGGSSGGSTPKTPPKNTTVTSPAVSQEKNVEYLAAQSEEPSEQITGNAVQEAIDSQPLLSPLRVIPIIFIIGVIIAVFIVKKKRRKVSFTQSDFRV